MVALDCNSHLTLSLLSVPRAGFALVEVITGFYISLSLLFCFWGIARMECSPEMTGGQ